MAIGKYLIFIFLSLLISASVLGQQKLLQGEILNDKDVEGIHILNRSSRFNTITDADGRFAIYANRGDTLFVSSVTYIPERVMVTDEMYREGYISVTLQELVNELDEVYLGPRLSGNLQTDLKNIEVEEPINFDDVGIPGFKGEPEEKIPNLLGEVITPLSVNIEGLYKHISGYYKTLRTRRKWEGENQTVARLINFYSAEFFQEAYQVPEHRLYDFLLFCIETSEIQSDFRNENYSGVLTTFKEKGVEYVSRLSEKEE